MLRTATISIFLSDAKCGPVCRAQTCAHSGVEPSRSAKAFLQGGPKSSKKFRIFHHFETLRQYISETNKKRHISSVWKKALSLPYPTVVCVWTHRPGVLQGGPKMSDAKPVFLISPIGLQPAIVPVSSQRREVRSNM